MAGDLDFLNQFPSLTGLFLNESTVTDDELVYLEPLTELRELNLSRTGVTDGGLVHLEPLTELTTLNIDGTAITFGGLRELFQAQGRPMIDLFRVPRYLQPTNYLQPDSLLRLDLRRTGLTDADLTAITKFPPAMHVFVDGSGQASAARVIQAIQFDPLEVLWLHAISFNRESLTSLAAARDLKMLWLTNASLEDSDLDVLERFPALEVLNLCGSPLTDSAIESLKELKSLRILVVDNTAFSESALQLLRASLPQLTVYPSQQHAIRAIRGRDRTIARLINAPSNIDETTPVRTEINGPDELLNIFGDAYFEEAESIDRASDIPASVLHQMQYISTLERVSFVNAADARRFLMEVRHAPVRRISLYRSKVDDDDLELIAGMDSLEELDLQRTDVTDACLATLASLPNLHVLRIGDSSAAVGDAGMSYLRELPLEELDLSRTRITAATLQHIGGIPTLRRLSLREVNVGDGLQHLQSLESLERLDLSNAEIEEDAWQPLLQMTSLRRLDLNGTTIPLDAVAELRSALPECDVVFREPAD